MSATPCNYGLFGVDFHAENLSDVCRHAFRVLYELDSEAIRQCVGTWPIDRPSKLVERKVILEENLGVDLYSIDRDSIQGAVRRILEHMGLPRSSFVIYAVGHQAISELDDSYRLVTPRS